MSDAQSERSSETRSYAIGYGLSLVLTAAVFAAVYWQSFTAVVILGLVLGLGVVQMLVHFRYFLHIRLRRSSREDLQILLFSALILALMVSGTLVILFNLRGRMM